MGTNQRNQIVMTDAEIAEFVARSRTGTMATISPDGQPHLVAMWYGVLDGEIWVETKAKSQKAVNLRRDPRVSFLIEDGMTYDSLRGVSFEGTLTAASARSAIGPPFSPTRAPIAIPSFFAASTARSTF